MTKQRNTVARYYESPGSWIGYNLIMGRSQHAGYWLPDTSNEGQAQKNYLQKMSEILALKKTEKVLDAGSGQGYAARYLAETTGAEITGITITPREVRISERLSRKTKNKPQFVLGDYAKTDFPNSYFDVIYTNETLSHVKNIKGAMSEFYRILKPGGRIVLFDYEVAYNSLDAFEKRAHLLLVEYAGGHGLNQMKPGEISGYLNSAGFHDVKEIDWSSYTKPTFDRLRKLARPLRWLCVCGGR